MKAKLMALIMAAGLGITGIAMTTQAAQASTTDTCRHETLNLKEHFESATYNDGNTHWSTYSIYYECSECGEHKFPKMEERLEWHDYEQIYYHDGSVVSTCLYCKYTY